MRSFHTVAIPFHANIHSVADHDHYCFYYMGTVGSTKTKINKESRELRWVSAKELDMLPNTPVNVKNLAKYAIESHSKRK